MLFICWICFVLGQTRRHTNKHNVQYKSIIVNTLSTSRQNLAALVSTWWDQCQTERQHPQAGYTHYPVYSVRRNTSEIHV